MRLTNIPFAVAAAVGLAAGATACASSAGPAGASGSTVTIGESTTLSGAIASLGQTGLQGVQLAADDLNAHGGVLGRQVKVVSADDAATPATGISNVRTMIEGEHVAAVFGPVASSVASAEEQITNGQRIPLFLHTSNDIGLTTTGFSPYVFQVVPNTVMEPRAVADYLAQTFHGRPVTVATFAPDYSFGHDTVSAFLAALRDLHVDATVVKQEFPPLGAPDVNSYLAAIESAHPQYVFNAQFGGDLVTFTKQAESYGLFGRTTVIAMYDYSVLQSLGSTVPAGAVGFDRAPFWTIDGKAMGSFVAEFRARYGDDPSEWAILGYAAVQQWAWAATKAKSFSGDAVSAALAGATVPTILGDLPIRGCDHQTELPEYVGVISASPNAAAGGVHLWDAPAFRAPFASISDSCSQMTSLQHGAS